MAPLRAMAIFGALCGTACGGDAIPVSKLADSKASIRAAEEAGAQSNPRAALHLKLANDQLDKAQALVNDGENERATLFLQQAQADADLALALSHQEEERKAALAAQQRVQELQQSRGQ